MTPPMAAARRTLGAGRARTTKHDERGAGDGRLHPRSTARRRSGHSTAATMIATFAPETAVRCDSPARRKSSSSTGSMPPGVADHQARQQPGRPRASVRAEESASPSRSAPASSCQPAGPRPGTVARAPTAPPHVVTGSGWRGPARARSGCRGAGPPPLLRREQQDRGLQPPADARRAARSRSRRPGPGAGRPGEQGGSASSSRSTVTAGALVGSAAGAPGRTPTGRRSGDRHRREHGQHDGVRRTAAPGAHGQGHVGADAAGRRPGGDGRPHRAHRPQRPGRRASRRSGLPPRLRPAGPSPSGSHRHQILSSSARVGPMPWT